MSSLTGLGCQRPLLAFRRMTKPVPPSPWPDTGFLGRNILRRCLFSKIKKRATWLFSRNSIICRISLKFSEVIIKVNCNEQFSNFLRKGIQYTKNNVINKRIRDQFHNCELNYCYIWIVRTVIFFVELKRIAFWLVKYYSDKFDNWGSELVYLYPWTLWLPEWVLYNVLLDLSVCPSGEFSSFSEFTFCRLLPSFPPLTKELTAWHCMTFHVVPQWRRWQMINIFMLSVVLSLTPC